jgi:hypothetical protein
VVVISRVARFVVFGALVWSFVCLVAAVNAHANWSVYVRGGATGTDDAVEAQARWQYWVDLTLFGVLAAVAGLVVVFWQVLRVARRLQVDRPLTEEELLERRGR